MASGFTKPPRSSLYKTLAMQRATRLLGIDTDTSVFNKEDVLASYRDAVREKHPDGISTYRSWGPLGYSTLQELRDAKDFLIKWLGENGDGTNI